MRKLQCVRCVCMFNPFYICIIWQVYLQPGPKYCLEPGFLSTSAWCSCLPPLGAVVYYTCVVLYCTFICSSALQLVFCVLVWPRWVTNLFLHLQSDRAQLVKTPKTRRDTTCRAPSWNQVCRLVSLNGCVSAQLCSEGSSPSAVRAASNGSPKRFDDWAVSGSEGSTYRRTRTVHTKREEWQGCRQIPDVSIQSRQPAHAAEARLVHVVQ